MSLNIKNLSVTVEETEALIAEAVAEGEEFAFETEEA